jgi:hypothetical protein
MHHSNSGIKQWPLIGALVTTRGKQVIGPRTVMYDCVADGQGGWVSREALPATRHEVRLTGETSTMLGIPLEQVVSVDVLTGRETVWGRGA